MGVTTLVIEERGAIPRSNYYYHSTPGRGRKKIIFSNLAIYAPGAPVYTAIDGQQRGVQAFEAFDRGCPQVQSTSHSESERCSGALSRSSYHTRLFLLYVLCIIDYHVYNEEVNSLIGFLYQSVAHLNM